MKNENLKSYVCNYKIEYEVEVNPYTKVIIQTQRQEQIISEPKDIFSELQVESMYEAEPKNMSLRLQLEKFCEVCAPSQILEERRR